MHTPEASAPADAEPRPEIAPVAREQIERLALSPEEAAEALGLSRAYTYELVRSGQLPARKVGRRRLVPVDALRAWLNEQPESA